MKPPAFWDNPPERPGLAAHLLAPVAYLAAALSARRIGGADAGWRAPVPVVCVGNLHLGGTGKTPAVIALAERLRARGHEVHVVSRGHGGRLKGPVRVIEGRHGAADVGDEPLLIAAFAPVWISRDRAAGVRAAAEAGAGIVLLDDGFQNPSVHKDLSIVVVDAARGFGNGRVFPAGPLREPVRAGLARADMVLRIGPEPARRRFDARWLAQYPDLPRLGGVLEPLETGIDWRGQRVLAFAGIGRPEKFFATLRDLGADVVRAEALEDHQPLGEALIRRLEAEALLRDAQLVTTEKDAVRLPAAFRQSVMTLPVRLRPEGWGPLEERLAPLIGGAGIGGAGVGGADQEAGKSAGKGAQSHSGTPADKGA